MDCLIFATYSVFNANLVYDHEFDWNRSEAWIGNDQNSIEKARNLIKIYFNLIAPFLV